MTTTYTGNTPATTTDYRPHPESTDSEFNLLQQAYARRGVVLEELRQRASELTSENASLKAHIEADHAFLSNTLGTKGLTIAHNPHIPPDIRTLVASDDGPEVVYDWSQDEDAVEYNFPSIPPPDDESSLYHLARLAYRQ